MNADEAGFDLQARDDGADPNHPQKRTTPVAPAPRQELHHPSEGRGGRPTTRRTARRPAAGKAPRDVGAAGGGLPFPFRPGFLLVLGALVLAVLWAGGLFSEPEAAGAWPWTLFVTEGGAFTFTWDAAHVLTALGAFFAVFFLLVPFAPANPSRGATVLTVAALTLVVLPAPSLLDHTVLLLGLLAAAVLSREGTRGGIGGRAFLFAALLLVGACLFFPIEPPGDASAALALAVGQDLFGGGSFGDVFLEPLTAVVLAAFVVFLVGLLSWLGLGGRWSVWVTGVFLLLGVLGPMVLAWHAAGAEATTCHEGLRAVVDHLPHRLPLLACVLPVAAGALDAARP